MNRPRQKTVVTTVKLSPKTRRLWELAAQAEHRTLSNTLEVLVLRYCAEHGITDSEEAASTDAKGPPEQ